MCWSLLIISHNGLKPTLLRKEPHDTAKILIREIIPRWGLTDQIDCVCKEVAHLLNIDWRLHCTYHPQSSGQVELTNRVLKERLSKMHQEGIKMAGYIVYSLI